MKNATKKVLAILMTLLMAVAMLPITASAAQYARIVVELNEPYYGDNLAEILPEIEIEAAYPFIEGYAFTVYYDHASDEDAEAAAEKLKANPLVKNAVYCPYREEDVQRAKFSFTLTSREKTGSSIRYVDLAELLPSINIVKAQAEGNMKYYIYCDTNSREEISMIYDVLIANPYITNVYYWAGEEKEVSVGRVKVTLNGKRSEDEVKELFPELKIEEVTLQGGNTYYLFLGEKTLRATLDAVDVLKNNSNVLAVSSSMGFLHLTVFPNELEEYYYDVSARSEVTVETALAALRIVAGLTEVNMELLNDELREVFWLYDVDIDGRITVSDALSLLRIAAGIKA